MQFSFDSLVYHADDADWKAENMQKVIVGLGELLWDLLPAGERLGGAPANFTVMASRLGNRGVIASRLGNDTLGASARDVLGAFPVDISLLQADAAHSTGTVGVEIRYGEPRYIIHEPAAWDFMEWTPKWRALAATADAVCFGSLAQRNAVSRTTIRQFLAATRPECARVFDVNLRPPFFGADLIAESLSLATIFKLNEVEVPQVSAMLGNAEPLPAGEAGLLRAAGGLLQKYPLRLVAITMGAEGSLLVTPDGFDRHPGAAVKVADTVGAGDAFTAALVHSYLDGASLVEMNEAGNRWGGWVASQPGAMPDLDAATVATITKQTQAAQGDGKL
jgi:fructokinase